MRNFVALICRPCRCGPRFTRCGSRPRAGRPRCAAGSGSQPIAPPRPAGAGPREPPGAADGHRRGAAGGPEPVELVAARG
ncbi:MAG: hypothetical protein M0C28_17785 [Candidatus Moduliflexus flocculans]|nr:hypothetical protein [Candidatus Moduliflexus flocculans]